MIEVSVRAANNMPLFIKADPDAFGKIFAAMNDADQVEVLRAMAKHMEPHRMQWDFISIELDKPENSDVRRAFEMLVAK